MGQDGMGGGEWVIVIKRLVSGTPFPYKAVVPSLLYVKVAAATGLPSFLWPDPRHRSCWCPTPVVPMPDTSRAVCSHAYRTLPGWNRFVVKAKGRCTLFDEAGQLPKSMGDCRLTERYTLIYGMFEFCRTVTTANVRNDSRAFPGSVAVDQVCLCIMPGLWIRSRLIVSYIYAVPPAFSPGRRICQIPFPDPSCFPASYGLPCVTDIGSSCGKFCMFSSNIFFISRFQVKNL